MFKIEDNTIHLTRGDRITIELTIEDYTFIEGDRVEFRIYNRKELNELPLLTKEIILEKEQKSIDIDLTSEETKIGEMFNKPIELWYEIELNNKITVLGYDENGPKQIILYPEGAEIDG